MCMYVYLCLCVCERDLLVFYISNYKSEENQTMCVCVTSLRYTTDLESYYYGSNTSSL